jgi:DNA-binding response OmpR family regulator
MNILLAEDDIRLGELVLYMLEKKGGFQVEWVKTGAKAYDYALMANYDVVILDWMMPGKSGVEVCRQLRNEGFSGAILMLTARDSVHDRVEGLDSGADDYLVKPFEFDELYARIRALARRNFAPILEEEIDIHGLVLNRTSFTVHQGKESIQLTPREFQLLDLLALNKGRVIPRENILDRIWGYDSAVSTKTVDATVKLLRKKLELFNKQDMIQSIRGVGYKLES